MRRGGIPAILALLFEGIIEACKPTIPAENWANKELIHQDRMKNISEKSFQEILPMENIDWRKIIQSRIE